MITVFGFACILGLLGLALGSRRRELDPGFMTLVGAIIGIFIGVFVAVFLPGGSDSKDWRVTETRTLVAGVTDADLSGQIAGNVFLIQGMVENTEYYKFWVETEFGVRADRLPMYGRNAVDVIEEDRDDGLWITLQWRCPTETSPFTLCIDGPLTRYELHVPIDTVVAENFRFSLDNR